MQKFVYISKRANRVIYCSGSIEHSPTFAEFGRWRRWRMFKSSSAGDGSVSGRRFVMRKPALGKEIEEEAENFGVLK